MSSSPDNQSHHPQEHTSKKHSEAQQDHVPQQKQQQSPVKEAEQEANLEHKDEKEEWQSHEYKFEVKGQADKDIDFDNFQPPNEQSQKSEKPASRQEKKEEEGVEQTHQIPQQQKDLKRQQPQQMHDVKVSENHLLPKDQHVSEVKQQQSMLKQENLPSTNLKQDDNQIIVQSRQPQQISSPKLPNPPLEPPSLDNVANVSTVIIEQAEKQRISATFSLFLKYNIEYQKTVSSYKLIIKNVRSQLNNKQQEKRGLHAHFLDYFETYIKINREFYERSAKVHKQQAIVATTNKLANIKEELKDGFQGMFSVRKTLTDQMRKLENYIITYTIKNLSDAFEAYRRQLTIEDKRQQEVVDKYQDSEKSFMKLFSAIEKIFKKGASGDKSKQDLFIWIVKFINQEKGYRQHLVNYGKTLLALKKSFVASQQQLFSALQKIINEFKVESRKVFAAKKENVQVTDNYLNEIESKCAFSHLCTITDVDYIRSVLQLQNRKEYIALTDNHFQQYLQLPFFDRIVGNKKDLFKGAINKCFPLHQPNEELVHTISGNLVHFNRQTEECKDKFQIRYLNARLIAQAGIQFDQVLKGIIFSDNRTVRIKMQSHDRAEELICYLNERDEWKGRPKVQQVKE